MSRDAGAEELVAQVLAGDRRALARVISWIEDDLDQVREVIAALYPRSGQAHLIGVTGASGTGKSTLVNELAKEYRRRGYTVGIVAVDPTSPFTGGAILGDRVRMRELSGDPGVFIRSMATRGSLGGLARATSDVVKALDAAGFQRILIETVGAGQAEVDIARTAHTTIVVEAPGYGDEIQAIKAGILEIADIFVVNKADREGADHTVMALEMMLDMNHSVYVEGGPAWWRPPVLKTVAIRGEGTPAVVASAERHLEHLSATGALVQKEAERAHAELMQFLSQELTRGLLRRLTEGEVAACVQRVVGREMDPCSAAQELIERCGR